MLHKIDTVIVGGGQAGLAISYYLTYRSREGAAPKMCFSLSRKAVAAFMLDAIDQHEHVHKIVGIAK